MNKVILMGRVTRDPELRNTQSNVAMCTFSLAVDRRFRSANGEKQTDFINIVTWRQTAEFVNNYFRKGLRVLVSGSLQTRSWEDQEGKRHYAMDVVADEVEFADGKPGQGEGGYDRQPSRGYDRPASSNYGSSTSQRKTFSKPYDTSAGDRFMETGDETSLPFDI